MTNNQWKVNISLINHKGHLIFVFCNRAMHLLQFTALMQIDISSPVVQISQWRLLPIIQTCNVLAVMGQKPHNSCTHNCWETNRMPKSELALRLKILKLPTWAWVMQAFNCRVRMQCKIIKLHSTPEDDSWVHGLPSKELSSSKSNIVTSYPYLMISQIFL